MSPDYLAPAFEVALDGVKLEPEVTATFTSLSVVHEPDSLDHFTLSVANVFPELPYTHGSKVGLFAAGSAVTIKLGYVDALEQVFDGEVTGVSLNFAEQASTVTIEGHSRLHRLRGDTRTHTFQDMTDSDIVTQIASDAGLQAKVDRTETKHPYVIQANQTDFDFLLDRARRIRYEVLAEGKTLIFRKPADGAPKKFTLIWGDPQRAFGPAGDTRPLLRFQPTLDATAPVTKVTVRGVDPTTREPITGTGTAGDQADQSGTSGAALVQKAFGRARETAVVNVPVASQAEADELAKAIFNRRAERLVRGSGATIGTPALRAGSVVDLQGLGAQFSGPYVVAQSTHRLDSSGYTTSFTARRGTVG